MLTIRITDQDPYCLVEYTLCRDLVTRAPSHKATHALFYKYLIHYHHNESFVLLTQHYISAINCNYSKIACVVLSKKEIWFWSEKYFWSNILWVLIRRNTYVNLWGKQSRWTNWNDWKERVWRALDCWIQNCFHSKIFAANRQKYLQSGLNAWQDEMWDDTTFSVGLNCLKLLKFSNE